jgi:hypothetical protein
MITLLDLARAVRGVLAPRHGGTGNKLGYAEGMLSRFTNGSGSAVEVGWLVVASSHGRKWATTTTTAASPAVLGVVIGHADGEDIIRENTASGEAMAILLDGIVRVRVGGTVSAGEFCITSTTAGKAGSSASYVAGSVGIYLEAGVLNDMVLVAVGRAQMYATAGMSNPMTTRGDMVTGGTGGDPQRLAVGAAGTVLQSDGTDPGWDTLQAADLTTRYEPLTQPDDHFPELVFFNGEVVMVEVAN